MTRFASPIRKWIFSIVGVGLLIVGWLTLELGVYVAAIFLPLLLVTSFLVLVKALRWRFRCESVIVESAGLIGYRADRSVRNDGSP